MLGVCKLSPEPTTLTSTDPPAPPLAPTDVADAGNRNANGALMPVRWGHRSRKSCTEKSRTEPTQTDKAIFSVQIRGTASFRCVSVLNFFSKTLSYWVIEKKKPHKTQNGNILYRFSNTYPTINTSYSDLGPLTLSLAPAPVTLPQASRSRSHRPESRLAATAPRSRPR